ncbi:MAG: AIPR family protein, partial [Euryarchaeota archaeon]|nr:AIPR family protein [Euryarchaeota archaeon]
MSNIKAIGTKAKPQFAHFLPEIIDKLQRTADTYLESFDEHQAFTHLIAEIFETTAEDRFTFTDGPKDGGIDFIVKDSPVYTIAQCKCPNMDRLKVASHPPSYDQAILKELLSAIFMLGDKSGDYDVKQEISSLRGDYQRDLATMSEETTLTAILGILGELSPQARKAFDSAKATLKQQNISLRLIEWTDIDQNIHARESPSDVSFDVRLNYDSSEDLLRHENYCYLLAQAFDFYEAFQEYGWALFDWNVRFQLHNSPINKRIVGTLQKARGRKSFHHYNNGLLITCKSYKHDTMHQRITLSGPQIINGCQTVRAICEAYDALTPVEQQEFRNRTRVQVKIIKTTDLDFISELVVSTNDQNPMKPRNLKSNSSEQRNIQRSFKSLPRSWFYQRKDGEFQSLASSSGFAPGFRKSDYAAEYKKYRVIDNEDLARVWYAFIGHADRALRGGIDLFADGKDGVYNRVFRSVPTVAFWSAFREPTYSAEVQFFEPGLPTPHQYLLAFAVAKYIDASRVSFRENRDYAIIRGIKSGALKGDPDTGMP